MHKTRFWNNHHQLRSKSKDRKTKKNLKTTKEELETVNRRKTDQNEQTLHRCERLSDTNALKTGGEIGCTGRVTSHCSTSGIRLETHFTNMVICHDERKDKIVITTNETYCGYL